MAGPPKIGKQDPLPSAFFKTKTLSPSAFQHSGKPDELAAPALSPASLVDLIKLAEFPQLGRRELKGKPETTKPDATGGSTLPVRHPSHSKECLLPFSVAG